MKGKGGENGGLTLLLWQFWVLNGYERRVEYKTNVCLMETASQVDGQLTVELIKSVC